MKKVLNLLKQTFREWSEDRAPRLAAALAYYTIFSFAPFLVLVITLTGMLYGRQAVEGRILNQVSGLIGPEGADFVASMIRSAGTSGAGGLAAVIGAVTLLLGALGMFGELQNSLNTIWNIRLKPTGGLASTMGRLVSSRLLSFTIVLAVGFLLLVSLVLTAVIASLEEYAGQRIPGFETALQAANQALSLLVISVLFAAMFKFLPDARIRWKDALIGGLVTSLLFTLGKVLIGLYLGNSRTGSTFGAAGSLVLLLVWVYYSAQILFLGAEFTQVYATTLGGGIQPEAHAIALTNYERLRQGMEAKDNTRPTLHPKFLPVTGDPPVKDPEKENDEQNP